MMRGVCTLFIAMMRGVCTLFIVMMRCVCTFFIDMIRGVYTLFIAMMRGVCAVHESCGLSFAPASSRISTISACPLSAAMCREVNPTSSISLTFT